MQRSAAKPQSTLAPRSGLRQLPRPYIKPQRCSASAGWHAAQQDVQNIRQGYGFRDGGLVIEETVLQNQEAACEVISAQLYNADAHVLSELLQNADDNQYSDRQPRLTLRFLPGRGVLLLNNEDGFTQRNVKAICALGQSSKSKLDGQTGEKGMHHERFDLGFGVTL